MWHLRESIPLAQAEEGPNIKHDISLPVSAIRDFVAATDAALQRALPGVRLVDFGHLGDGNLHYNVQAPAGEDAAEFLAATSTRSTRCVYDAVGALRRLDLGRARHRPAEARRAARAQVAGGAGDDAGDQGGARPRGRAESGARASAASHAVKAATSGRRAAAGARRACSSPCGETTPSAKGATSLLALSRLLDQRHAAERHALAGDRRLDQLVVRREVQHRGRLELGQLHRMQPEAPVLQLVAAVGLHAQQGLVGEIGRHLERRAGGAQQRGLQTGNTVSPNSGTAPAGSRSTER